VVSNPQFIPISAHFSFFALSNHFHLRLDGSLDIDALPDALGNNAEVFENV
jgi:hypothetical protein